MHAEQEIRRLRYLQAMGVPTYVSRRELPGAATTLKLALRAGPQAAPGQPSGAGQSSAGADSTAGRAPGTSAAPPAAAALRESLRSARTGTTARAEPGGERGGPEAPRAQPTPQASPRFRLATMVAAQRLWLEELGDEALARQQLELVAAMGRALLHPAPAGEASASEFQWPMHANQQLDLGADEAFASLQGFLLRKLDDNACVEVICMGEAAGELVRGLKLPCARRQLPATREMLKEPRRKRDAWAALRS